MQILSSCKFVIIRRFNYNMLTSDVVSTTPSTSKNNAPGIRHSCKDVQKIGLLCYIIPYAKRKQMPNAKSETLYSWKGFLLSAGIYHDASRIWSQNNIKKQSRKQEGKDIAISPRNVNRVDGEEINPGSDSGLISKNFIPFFFANIIILKFDAS